MPTLPDFDGFVGPDLDWLLPAPGEATPVDLRLEEVLPIFPI